jgi:predicted SprT family Zn-dependent metalloprotease
MADKIKDKITFWYNYSKQIWPIVLDDWVQPGHLLMDLGHTCAFALFDDNVLLFDARLYENNTRDFLTDVVGHEMAHLIAYRLYGDIAVRRPHGAKWQNTMIRLGLAPKKFYNFDTSHVPQDEQFFCLCSGDGCSLCKKSIDNSKRHVKVGM